MKEMVLALLSETDLSLSDDMVESIVQKVLDIVTFWYFAFLSFCFLDIYIGHICADNDGGRFRKRWEDRRRRMEGIREKKSVYHKEHDSSVFEVGSKVLSFSAVV